LTVIGINLLELSDGWRAPPFARTEVDVADPAISRKRIARLRKVFIANVRAGEAFASGELTISEFSSSLDVLAQQQL